MDVIIRGQNVAISANMKAFIEERLGKLDRFLPNITRINVDISQQKARRGPDQIIAQITIRHKRGAILRAEEKTEVTDDNTLKTAMNNAIDKMYSRIQRFKGKRRNKRVRDRYMATKEELSTAEALPDMDETSIYDAFFEDPDDYSDSMIIRRKDVVIAAMNEEEAIEQMELLGHTFFLFFNPDTEQINVVYKRSAGGYGVMNPELE